MSSPIARNVKFTAHPGQGEPLAARLLAAAEQVQALAGCRLYRVGRAVDDPDVVWVCEEWRSAQDADAALHSDAARAAVAATMELLAARPELIALTPLGGKGVVDAAVGVPPYTRIALDEVDDLAPAQGLGAMGEARFANEALATRATGVSLQRLRPGARQPFGHRHVQAEEVYVVLEGSGRVKLDDELVEVRAGDAIRVAPPVTRAFEAGADGLTLLAVGPRTPGDGEVLMDWWPSNTT